MCLSTYYLAIHYPLILGVFNSDLLLSDFLNHPSPVLEASLQVVVGFADLFTDNAILLHELIPADRQLQ